MDRNLLALLAYPNLKSSNLVARAASAAGLSNFSCDFDGCLSARDRLLIVLNNLSVRGVKPTDIFLMDEPLVSPIEVAKKEYSIYELSLLEGDSFITHLVRSLMKRNPFTKDFFVLGQKLAEMSKADCVRWFATLPGLNASVIDLDEHPVVSLEHPEYQRFIQDFRSPIAGGWDLRNHYLETKRNYSRFWLKSKVNRDVWWMQADADMGLLSS